MRIFFISDIHRRKIDNKLLKKIDTDIDIVIIGGDLAERGVPLTRISKNICNLSKIAPIYYVWGNNDREVGEQEIRNIFKQFGGKILDNENTDIPNHAGWGICGTDDPSTRRTNIESTLVDIERFEHVICVSHQPKILNSIEAVFQPAFMIAGHTHGGQIRFGKFGLFERGSFLVSGNRGKLISNGYGTSTVPLRLGAPSECHIINLYYTGKEVEGL